MIPPYVIVPYAYFLKTRLAGLFQKISWVFVYFIPVGFLYFQFADIRHVADHLLLIIGFLLINYVYENGYLENDIATIKKEKDPTLRLPAADIEVLGKSLSTIFLIRSVVILILLIAYYFFISDSSDIQRPADLWILLIVLQILYLVYNRIRNILNLLLIWPLSFIRFFGFIIPFIPGEQLLVFIIMASLLYPLPKLLEFTRRERFKLKLLSRIVGNIDAFRVKYYIIVLLLCVIIKFVYPRIYIYPYLIISAYYLLYRGAGLFLIKNKNFLSEFKNNFGRK
jgi:hypothetical protein